VTDYPFYREFRDGLADVAFLKKSGEALDILTDRFGEVHLTLANDVVSLAQSLGWNCQDVFLQYIFDYLKEQMAFEQTGEYGHTDFEQIREDAEALSARPFSGVSADCNPVSQVRVFSEQISAAAFGRKLWSRNRLRRRILPVGHATECPGNAADRVRH
jgi:hypothetical protein